MENHKLYAMALLYKQSNELNHKINSDHQLDSLKCVLISKETLDKHKSNNNYEKVKNDHIFGIESDDYEEFKNKIRAKYKIDENKLPVMDSILLIDINWSLGREILDVDNIDYPDKMEIVSYQYFKDCYKGETINKKYDAYIGYRIVIIIDTDNDNTVYLCSLVDENSCQIKVDVLLKFENSDILKNHVKKTTVDNYLSSDSNDGNSKGDEGYGAGFTLVFKF